MHTVSIRAAMFLVSLILGMTAAVQAAEYVVAAAHPQASDDGPGSSARPWRTIGHAAARVAAGDRVLVLGGLYREGVTIKASGTDENPISFTAAPGECVVMTGADRMTGWTKVEPDRPLYRIAWPHKFIGWNRSMAHPDDARHVLIGRAEQVFVNGYALRQVLARDQLAPGTFLADVANQTLFAWDSAGDDLNTALTEAATRTAILRVEGSHVSVRGFRFRYAANAAQHGAVIMAGRHGVLEDCVIEAVNSSGATFNGEDLVVRRCTFRGNGQLGFGSSHAHRLLVTECLVEDNNTKNFDRGWEAGGCKLCLGRGVVIEKSRFLRNRGCGVWFDIGNEQSTVRNCLIADNDDAGIFYEISYGLHAHDNVVVGNGFAATRGAWGAQGGITLSSSPECVVERNLLVGNREGFTLREQLRTTPRVDVKEEQAVWNHDELIRHNVIAFNRDAQVAGWFDVADNRHWPAGEAAAKATPEPRKRADLAAPYGAKPGAAQPQGLTLEKLKIRFESNAYFAAAGQPMGLWGTPWRAQKRYESVEAFRAALALDTGGSVVEPRFVDLLARDLRLTADAADTLRPCYPRGTVPGVTLGVVSP